MLFFSVFKTCSPLQFSTDRYGYDYGWFLCVYLIGAWIRRYGFSFLKNARRGLALYLACAGLTAAGEILLLFLSKKIGALTYYASVPFHYNFLPCIAGAVGLFAFFAHVRLPEGFLTKTVRFWSPAVFGVYLIHEHVDVSANWCEWTAQLTGISGPALLIPAFCGCLVIDKLRGALFTAVGRAVDNCGGRRLRAGKCLINAACGTAVEKEDTHEKI